MKKSDWIKVSVGGALVLAVCAAGAAGVRGAAGENTTAANRSSGVVTNDNGSVSRTYVESTVSTNGNLVTEHRRETRTMTDREGNILSTTTSEYARSYPAEDADMAALTAASGSSLQAVSAPANDAFLGVTFGEPFAGTNFTADADEPALLRAKFEPKKPLAGFDDYYVYVTPETHRVAKIFACAKEAVDPGSSWSRHYLIEALEKRYGTWARPRSWCRPIYTFDIGDGRFVTACLDGANADYATIIAACDADTIDLGAREAENIRAAARKAAAEKRAKRVSSAAEAF